MTATTTQLTTRLRTWAFVAGLTALTIAIGAMLGGTFLWLFVAFAIAFNVVGYFFSDRIALRAARARLLTVDDAPGLHAIVSRLSERADIPMPRLYVMPGEQPNAFATGRNPEHAAVALTEGLLTTMEPEHVRGVVAHALGASGTVATLFSTHRPVRERIRRLQAYGEPSRSERTARTASLSGV